ncbi:MAG: 2-dehydropantoate 2-reductase N-terminal domain-containing protein, partial [Chloroflexota bacterium]
MTKPRVVVVGSGAWGTTLALLVARSEPVALLCQSAETAARITAERRNERRLPGIDLPASVFATADPAILEEAELVIVAVPSTHLREVIGRIASHILAAADILSVVKGIEHGTLLRMTQVIADAAGIEPGRVAALSGPNLALEIARGLPASAVVAAADEALAERIVARL